jgi:bifunctional NMN adenylyltransferase/nudix hydrolase
VATATRTLGVIIARFQTPELTAAHQYLIAQVATRSVRVVIMLGVTRAVSKKNPLEFILRTWMVEDFWSEHYPGRDGDLFIIPDHDCPTDEQWARRIDEHLDALIVPGSTITIFCGPDGAGRAYQSAGGRHPFEVFDSDGIHATAVRANVMPERSASFRRGVIYGAERRATSVFPVIDVVIWRRDPGAPATSPTILLGRKDGDGERLRLVGGFVDPTDDSLEAAVLREAREETGLVVDNVTYAGSQVVDDWRYRGAPETLLSAVFNAETPCINEPLAGDDLDEVRWCTPVEALDLINPMHLPLLKMALAARRRSIAAVAGGQP